jgi:hypothetical protein
MNIPAATDVPGHTGRSPCPSSRKRRKAGPGKETGRKVKQLWTVYHLHRSRSALIPLVAAIAGFAMAAKKRPGCRASLRANL